MSQFDTRAPAPWDAAAGSTPDPVTQAVRAGIECDDTTGCVVPPLHLSSTFAFRAFGEKRAYDYTRSGNPTRDLLADALAELEQGAGAVVTASGMAAITVVGYLVPVGARIVAPHDCYGGTYRLFEAWRRRGERQVEFIDFGDEAAVRAALSQPTALVWIETPSNPLLRITDIAAVAALGHACGALVVVDNTFLSPALAAAAHARRGPGGALDHQVPQRPQRRGRRRGRRARPRRCTSSWCGGPTAWGSPARRSTAS